MFLRSARLRHLSRCDTRNDRQPHDKRGSLFVRSIAVSAVSGHRTRADRCLKEEKFYEADQNIDVVE